MITPEEFSNSLGKTGIKPVKKTFVGDELVYVADGWVHPWQYGFLDRFGVTATTQEFPYGCFATLYYRHGKVGKGGMELSKTFFQSERVSAILKHAEEDIRKERKARLNG